MKRLVLYSIIQTSLSEEQEQILSTNLITQNSFNIIPIPWVTHNEQMENAKVLESIGLARYNEGELTPEKLQVTLRLFSKEKIDVNEKKANEIFIKNAAFKIIKNINFS